MSTALEPLALSPRDALAFVSISTRGLSRLIRAGKIEAASVARASMLPRCCRKKPTICRSSLVDARMQYCGAKPDPSLMI
jgi:hypothetical protein